MSHSIAYLLAGLFLVPGSFVLAMVALGRKPTPRFEATISKSASMLEPATQIEAATRF